MAIDRASEKRRSMPCAGRRSFLKHQIRVADDLSHRVDRDLVEIWVIAVNQGRGREPDHSIQLNIVTVS